MSKKLVAFFSASGNTAALAEKLAKAAGADLYEIKPAVSYTREDLNWQNKQSRSSVEMSDHSSRPALADTMANVSAYDTIYIGFPVWWYIAPTIINSFLESYDFSGKTLALFATSGGTGLTQPEDELPKLVPNATWKPGRLFNDGIAESTLRAWANGVMA